MAGTNKRAAARSGCKAVLDSYKATYTDSTQSTYLAHVYDHQPPRITGRSAWVNKQVGEQIAYSNSLRQRVLQPSITVVNKVASNDQAADEQDAIVDALLDIATNLSRTAVSGAVLLPASVDDAEVTSDDGVYTGFSMTFNLLVQEGRSI